MFTIIGADGKEYGPVDAASITQWIAAGRANLQTKARRTGDSDWKTLAEFPEFAAPPITTPPTSTPVATLPAAVPASPTNTGNLELASRGLRLGAQLIDGIISGICAAPGFIMLMSAGIFSSPNNPNGALLFAGIAAIGLAILILLAVQIYLLTTRGQTIGKKLLGVKIVNFDDETNPGFVKAFLLRVFVNGLIGGIPFLGVAYTLVDICFIFREDRRCIHDLLAGTKVVKA